MRKTSPLSRRSIMHPAAALVAGIVLTLTTPATSQTPPAQAALTDVNEIARRVIACEDRRHSALHHYESSRTYHLVYNGIGGEHIADLVVQAQYDSPGVKHLTVVRQTGSKGFGDKVLRRLVQSEEEASQRDNRQAMAFTAENFEMKLVGQENIDGVPAYVLSVAPRDNNKFAYSGKVWISMADFAIIRVEGSPAKEPTWMVSNMKFDTHYIHVGDYWLPENNHTITHLMMGGEVEVTIDYGPYTNLQASHISMDYASISGGK